MKRDLHMHEDRTSYFGGTMGSYIGLIIINALITFFTLGFGFPWAICNIYRWEMNNTVIDGKRLQFTGTGWSLFGQWIKWWFLTLLTFGIYGFWVHIKLLDWKVSHTTFEDEFYDF